MKKIKKIILLGLVTFIAHIVTAQNVVTYGDQRPAKWVSEKGFWNIETNIKTPKTSIVRFYDNNQQLVYTEKVEGVVLNIKRKKTLLHLKTILDKVVDDWEKNGVVKDQGQLVAVLKGGK